MVLCHLGQVYDDLAMKKKFYWNTPSIVMNRFPVQRELLDFIFDLHVLFFMIWPYVLFLVPVLSLPLSCQWFVSLMCALVLCSALNEVFNPVVSFLLCKVLPIAFWISECCFLSIGFWLVPMLTCFEYGLSFLILPVCVFITTLWSDCP